MAPPTGGHIARRSFQKTLETDAAAKEAFEKQVRIEKEARRVAREVRIILWEFTSRKTFVYSCLDMCTYY